MRRRQAEGHLQEIGIVGHKPSDTAPEQSVVTQSREKFH